MYTLEFKFLEERYLLPVAHMPGSSNSINLDEPAMVRCLYSPASFRTASRVCFARRKPNSWSLSIDGSTASRCPARFASSNNPSVPLIGITFAVAMRRASASSRSGRASRHFKRQHQYLGFTRSEICY